MRAGRVGYYDERHLARLSIVGELLERGYSLASIRELIDAWEAGGDLGQLLGFEKALARPWSDEHPVLVTAAELEARFGADPAALRRAVELHLVVPEEDGFLVPSMQALEAGAAGLGRGPSLGRLRRRRKMGRDSDPLFVAELPLHHETSMSEAH